MHREEAVYAGAGSVYHFTEAGGWACVDGGASHVYLYRNNATLTYRLLGSTIASQEWVLNTPVHRDVKLQVSQQTFASWRDTTGAGFGVHFATEADLKKFSDAIEGALRHSREAAAAAASQAAAATDAALAAAEALIAKSNKAGTLRKNAQVDKGSEPALVVSPASASEPVDALAAAGVQVEALIGVQTPATTATPQVSVSSDADVPPVSITRGSPSVSDATASPGGSRIGLHGSSSTDVNTLTGSQTSLVSGTASLRPSQVGKGTARTSVGGEKEKKISNVRASVAMDATTVSTALAANECINADGSKNLRKATSGLNERELVAREIFTTEYSYFTALDLLVQCMESASSSGVLPEADVRAIFLNVRPVRTLSAQLLAEFQQRVERWTEAQKLGDVFLQLIPFFKVYRDFCAAYDSALQAYQKASERKDVRAHFKLFEPTGTDGAVQALSFLLIMPVQRIPRYVLLLKELIKRTTAEHTDTPDLLAALAQLQDFASGVNEQMREAEQARRLAEILASGHYQGLAEALETHNSKLLFECSVQGRLAPARALSQVVLFHDMLALLGPADAKRPDGAKRVELCVPLEVLWLAPVADSAAKSLTLQTPDTALQVECENDVARKHLGDAITRALPAWLAMRAVPTKTTPPVIPNTSSLSSESPSTASVNLDERKVAYAFADGRHYDGWWRIGAPHGHGVMKWPQGPTSYTGEWVNGRFEGSGKLSRGTAAGESTIEGEWQAGVPHGQATLVCGTHQYKGAWQHGMRHGQGTFSSPLGEVASGEWVEDQISGNDCKVVHACGALYEGAMRNDRPEGQGKMTWYGGAYTGEWREGRKEGQGTLVSASGDEQYSGQWRDDKREGKGTHTHTSSKAGAGKSASVVKYEGEWKADRRHGHGTLVGPEGTLEGEWRDNGASGNAMVLHADGSKYEGELAAFMREGKGKLTRPNGDLYDGRWHASRRFGRGVETSAQEGKYDGEFQRDERHGKGTLLYTDGSKYSGDWEGGMRHGEGFFNSPGDVIKYNGHWQRDKRHGQGMQIDKNGKYEGEWKADRRDGTGAYRCNRTQQLFQGTWLADRRDGDGVITFADGSQIKVHYRNGLRMRPPTVPPTLPHIPHFTKS